MTFRDAADFRMQFGKYAGKTLDEIATTDEGLRYLDWLRGMMGPGQTLYNLTTYLDDTTIAADVARLARKS